MVEENANTGGHICRVRGFESRQLLLGDDQAAGR